MPFLQRACGARIYYERTGTSTANAILLLAPGGMRSSIPMWHNQPFNPLTALDPSKFTMIAMDQRNAGQSTGPISPAEGWKTFRDDQLALLDHLGFQQCLLLGSCIGPSYAFQLMRDEPARFPAAVLLQPIGLAKHTTEPGHPWQQFNWDASSHWFGHWAAEMLNDNRATREELAELQANMFGGRNFVFSATRSEVAAISKPLLVLMGRDMYHPSEIARDIARIAPNAELIEEWRDAANLPAAAAAIEAFLDRHADPEHCCQGM